MINFENTRSSAHIKHLIKNVFRENMEFEKLPYNLKETQQLPKDVTGLKISVKQQPINKKMAGQHVNKYQTNANKRTRQARHITQLSN